MSSDDVVEVSVDALAAACGRLRAEAIARRWDRVDMDQWPPNHKWRCSYGDHYSDDKNGWSSKREQSPVIVCTPCRNAMDHGIEAAERGWLSRPNTGGGA